MTWIRVALGADARAVRRLVLGTALRLVGMSTVLGIAAALASGRWIESQPFGVSAGDPKTLMLVALALWRHRHWPRGSPHARRHEWIRRSC